MITWRETVCKCGCGLNITTKFHNTINDFREAFDSPMVPSSGARCPPYNVKKGGKLKSAHIEGRAIDFEYDPKLAAFCNEANLEKYGLFMEDPASTPGWLHLTDRPYTTWKPGKTRVFKP
jgi:hypothetical protein